MTAEELRGLLEQVLAALRAGECEQAAALVHDVQQRCAAVAGDSAGLQELRPLLQECQAAAAALQACVGESLKSAGAGRRAVGGYSSR